MTLSDEQYLEKFYYNPKNPASFSSPIKLYEAIKKQGKRKISLATIKKWLSGEDTYTFHRAQRKPYKRNKVIVDGIDSQWDMDVMDMQPNSKDNDDVKYILLAIDIFSRFVFLQPLHSRKASDMLTAMKVMFKDRKPEFLRTDKGVEFVNASVKQYLKDNDIVHFVTQNTETKANYAERAIRTIKGRIVKYFTKTLSHRYVDELQNFAIGYNHTKHRSIGMAPIDVNTKNEPALWRKQYLSYLTKKKKKSPYRFKIGDRVKIPSERGLYDKDYDYKWTGEIFTVTQRRRRQGIPVYKIKGFDDKPIKGTFYQSELQKVIYDPDKPFLVHKVVAKRGNKVKVNWLGWPKQYDSWIDK